MESEAKREDGAMGDLLVKGGLLIDGTGSAARPADVRVRGGLVTEVGPDLAPDGEEVIEAVQFGGPWWKAGKKSFCIYGGEGGRSGAAFNLSPDHQADLVNDPRFSPTSHLGHHGWTTMVFERKVDWALVEELVDTAYRRVALKRMLKTLD